MDFSTVNFTPNGDELVVLAELANKPGRGAIRPEEIVSVAIIVSQAEQTENAAEGETA